MTSASERHGPSARWLPRRAAGRAVVWLDADGAARLVLRAVVVITSLAVSLVTATAAGGGPVLVGYVVALTMIAAVKADGPVPLALIVVHATAWAISVPRPDSPRDLVLPLLVAALLVVLHLAASALGVWPPGAVVPANARRYWARDAVAIIAGTVPVALFGALVLLTRGPGSALASVAALVALGIGTILVWSRSTG